MACSSRGIGTILAVLSWMSGAAKFVTTAKPSHVRRKKGVQPKTKAWRPTAVMTTDRCKSQQRWDPRAQKARHRQNATSEPPPMLCTFPLGAKGRLPLSATCWGPRGGCEGWPVRIRAFTRAKSCLHLSLPRLLLLFIVVVSTVLRVS